MSRLLALSTCIFLSGCAVMDPPIVGSGKDLTEKREVPQFTAIELAVGTADLVVNNGDTISVELTWDDNLLPLVTTTVVDGVLEIGVEGNTSSAQAAKIRITAPRVSSVAVSGAGRVSVEELSGPKAELSISGSGDMIVGVNAEEFACEIAGSGTIKASGTCPKVSVAVRGSGDVSTTGVLAETVEIDIAGAGTVAVHAETNLDVSIAGSGDVSYSGKPQIRQSVAGSGSIKARPAAAPQIEGATDKESPKR